MSLLVGVLACSTAVIWIKLCTLDPVLLTGVRLAAATALLAPWAVRDWRRHREAMTWGHVRDAAVPGVVFAIHLMTWIYGARLTLASNGVLIVNLTPIVTPLLLAALLNERVNRREIVATLLAAVGLVILFIADFRASPETFRGDLVCFGSMFLLALYLTLGRKFRHHPTTLLYVTPLYATAGVLALGAAPLLADPEPVDWWAEAPWVLLLTLLPTVLGHSLINNAMRRLRGQVVSLMNMLQFVFAGLLASVWLGETPAASFYPAAACIVGAGVLAVRAPGPKTEPPTTD